MDVPPQSIDVQGVLQHPQEIAEGVPPEPEWSSVEAIAAMQKTITISWEGAVYPDEPVVNKTNPELAPGLNRYRRDDWGLLITD